MKLDSKALKMFTDRRLGDALSDLTDIIHDVETLTHASYRTAREYVYRRMDALDWADKQDELADCVVMGHIPGGGR